MSASSSGDGRCPEQLPMATANASLLNPEPMHHYDFVIIGAGIAGASMGWELAGQRRVLLLERES